MFITKIVKRVHKGEKGFTLIELLVVMAILAFLVGLVMPNFFGITEGADAIMIQGQHEKMREAVYLYHEDTIQFPSEWSGAPLATEAQHQLWFANLISGWDGPYIERPILQKNRWGGNWGVWESVSFHGMPGLYTVLFYDNVPRVVCEQVDRAMDDGHPTNGWQIGAVQFRTGTNFPGTGNAPTPEGNRLTIVIAKQ